MLTNILSNYHYSQRPLTKYNSLKWSNNNSSSVCFNQWIHVCKAIQPFHLSDSNTVFKWAECWAGVCGWDWKGGAHDHWQKHERAIGCIQPVRLTHPLLKGVSRELIFTGSEGTVGWEGNRAPLKAPKETLLALQLLSVAGKAYRIFTF